jgi:hypothetical protein
MPALFSAWDALPACLVVFAIRIAAIQLQAQLFLLTGAFYGAHADYVPFPLSILK